MEHVPTTNAAAKVAELSEATGGHPIVPAQLVVELVRQDEAERCLELENPTIEIGGDAVLFFGGRNG